MPPRAEIFRMSPEDVSDASDVPSATTARLLRRLADIDAACFPLASDRGVAALRASARLRRAVKIVVSYDDHPSSNPIPAAFVAYAPGSAAFHVARVATDRTVAEEATRARLRVVVGGGARETRVTRDAPRGIDERFRTRRHGALSETRVRRRRRQPDDEGFLRSRETRREHAPKTRPARKRVTIVQTVRVTNGFAGRRRFCGKTSSSRAWIDRAPDHA